MIKKYCDVCGKEADSTVAWGNESIFYLPSRVRDPEHVYYRLSHACMSCNLKIIRAIDRLKANAGQEYA